VVYPNEKRRRYHYESVLVAHGKVDPRTIPLASTPLPKIKLTRAQMSRNTLTSLLADRSPNPLTGITDEKGTRYGAYRYDSRGRAIVSEHLGGADRATFTYHADGSTTVTNALGRSTRYRFTTIGGVKRVSRLEGQATANCAAANKAYTYTAEGWIDTQTDWEGNVTDFDYNSRGLVIRRIEGKGTPEQQISTTEWHPTLPLPVRITEPHQITEIRYDEKGRVLSSSVRALR
jgi:uncharacterized protein RhaS with RHS repeats